MTWLSTNKAVSLLLEGGFGSTGMEKLDLFSCDQVFSRTFSKMVCLLSYLLWQIRP